MLLCQRNKARRCAASPGTVKSEEVISGDELLPELDGTGSELYNSGLLTHVSDLIWLHEGPISSFKHHVPHPAHFDLRWTRSVKFPFLSA